MGIKMAKKFRKYWDQTYKKYLNEDVKYDDWLDKYQYILSTCQTNVLDFGSGTGNDTLYLVERGYSVLACDYSKVALQILKKNVRNAKTKLLDISKTLPFSDDSFDVVIADLSLHYFDEKTTEKIMRELKRILTPHGHLIARVNSLNDINFGAGQGQKIEENYYFVDGYNKRFFNKEDVFKYFSIIGDVFITEAVMDRYEKPKNVLEILVTKK